MNLQTILRIAGIALLVAAALFALLAIQYFLSKDIRSVMDDLSGKARARGVASSGSQGRQQSTARRSGSRRPARVGRDEGRPAAAAPVQVREVVVDDGPGTALVAAPVEAPVVANAPVQNNQGQAPAAQPIFQLTRSIVLTDSQEVIAFEGGL
jgi:hypothetical protein